jgi:diguanylate cyclase (GGDEF)-like protein
VLDRLLRRLRGAEPASAAVLDRARRSGLLLGGLATFVAPAWSVFDALLEPASAATFVAVRLVGTVPMLVILGLLWRHPVGRRRPELLTWLLLSVVQCEVAWMIPRTRNVEFYLLGFTLAIYASGCMLVARPIWTAARVAPSGTALAVGLASAPGGLAMRLLAAAAVYVGTSSLIGLVAHAQRFRLAERERRARVRLEEEQGRTNVLLDRLERLSNEDSLTGVANRRRWDEHLAAVCARAEDGVPIAVILADVDRFKEVNDRYGHAGGDAALRDVADLLVRRVRTGDLVARLGGDELAVLLPGADADRAVQLAERLRADAAMLQPPGFAAGGITLSLGVAVAVGGRASGERLMSEADAQLYRAKSTRNAVGAPADSLAP